MTFFFLKALLVVIAGLMGSLHNYQLESPRAAELSPGADWRDEDRNEDEKNF
jgi:hypothetical protein